MFHGSAFLGRQRCSLFPRSSTLSSHLLFSPCVCIGSFSSVDIRLLILSLFNHWAGRCSDHYRNPRGLVELNGGTADGKVASWRWITSKASFHGAGDHNAARYRCGRPGKPQQASALVRKYNVPCAGRAAPPSRNPPPRSVARFDVPLRHFMSPGAVMTYLATREHRFLTCLVFRIFEGWLCV